MKQVTVTTEEQKMRDRRDTVKVLVPAWFCAMGLASVMGIVLSATNDPVIVPLLILFSIFLAVILGLLSFIAWCLYQDKRDTKETGHG